MAQQQPDTTCKPPSTSTFSFTAPFPAHLKQRRVSLATPSSPRLVPAWSFRDDTGLGAHAAGSSSASVPGKKGKMRKIAVDGEWNEDGGPDGDGKGDRPKEKRQRKKWTMEETQMLVDGCNTWGVGNWKAILKDPNLKFDNRSPVDLKDRFRTYFPDAYKQHYPNAKTHLSSKVRSTLPDGSSIFEKTRSKKRRPFTEEEDKALKAGYEKHGTVWAAIVKDPVFQEHNRRSTDLRDRFRNAFPELYEAAGYKPRRSIKKKKGDCMVPIRAATDDQLVTHSTSGYYRRKRAHTNEGLFRGGTKSVPQSVMNSEDEDSSGDEDELDVSISPSVPDLMSDTSLHQLEESPSEADMIDQLADPLAFQDFLPESSQTASDSSQSQTWSSGVDTPLHTNSWSTATTGSPTSSHISSECFFNQSPFDRRGESSSMIGKSAWGMQDWFSANPRMDPSANSSSSSSYIGGLSPTPSSPFSFHAYTHGVVDRYDLFPTSFPTDFASEAGVGDTHSTFSDPDMFPMNTFRGFTHHSNYAGDLIFGTRTHQPQHQSYSAGFGSFETVGLGLSGMQQQQQSAGIHPMQLHGSGLPGIDELELTAISLNDHDEPDGSMEDSIDMSEHKDDSAAGPSLADLSAFSLPPQTMEEIAGLSQEFNPTPPATPVSSARPMRGEAHHSSMHSRSVSVPPFEHRPAPRTSQTMSSAKAPTTPTRSLSFFDSILTHGDEPLLRGAYVPSVSPAVDPWKASGDRDVPFLDLHYYSSALHGAGGLASYGLENDPAEMRQGQALDLAQSYTSLKTLNLPASLTQHIPPMSSGIGGSSSAGRQSLHHRVQSAVSPQDLLLNHSADNKRKRASWDGGLV
ncbi:hypothetical protein JAAARDRAFT_186063 [Jaapia argillacea MUCL 33604]|uniref:Myb-like domain-containing protein n=1 Tax=Jaapia argillacea MUCL 33604 TaxID=933084 RepID=A0A067PHU3_9AGAM|nr:hypothetical protein JAAARDRAFT_186063 [Jaapia argillacea MUCL 33604]